MRNVAAALEAAGCGMADVVRVRYVLPDRNGRIFRGRGGFER